MTAQNASPDRYFDFKSRPTACAGEIKGGGSICTIEYTGANAESITRESSMIVLTTLTKVSAGTSIATKIVVSKLTPNPAKLDYIITITTMNTLTNMEQKLARAGLKKDGTIKLDKKYGEYGSKEASDNLKKYSREILLSISALK